MEIRQLLARSGRGPEQPADDRYVLQRTAQGSEPIGSPDPALRADLLDRRPPRLLAGGDPHRLPARDQRGRQIPASTTPTNDQDPRHAPQPSGEKPRGGEKLRAHPSRTPRPTVI